MFTDLLSHVRLGSIQTVSDPTLLSINNGKWTRQQRKRAGVQIRMQTICTTFLFSNIFASHCELKKRINIRLFLKVQFRMFCVLRMFVSSALFLFFYTWRDLKNQGHPATLHTTRSPAIDGMALKE